MSNSSEHPHPTDFRLVRALDRGWGELAFEYRWRSTLSNLEERDELPELADCVLYEITTYAGNAGRYKDGWLYPPDPPFLDWKFRDPTDGRTAPVGLECFPATQGWAWDRHKLGGRLIVPPQPAEYRILAHQRYWAHCAACGVDFPLTPIQPIERHFAPIENEQWRYTLTKHGYIASLTLDCNGYVTDSRNIGFSPW